MLAVEEVFIKGINCPFNGISYQLTLLKQSSDYVIQSLSSLIAPASTMPWKGKIQSYLLQHFSPLYSVSSADSSEPLQEPMERKTKQFQPERLCFICLLEVIPSKFCLKNTLYIHCVCIKYLRSTYDRHYVQHLV